jgi:hypothetical protein
MGKGSNTLVIFQQGLAVGEFLRLPDAVTVKGTDIAAVKVAAGLDPSMTRVSANVARGVGPKSVRKIDTWRQNFS